MLYKIGCSQMHPIYVARPEPYVPLRVSRGAVIAHRFTYAASSLQTSQYRMTFIALSAFQWKDLGDPVFDGVHGTGGFQEQGQRLFIGLAARSLFV